MNMGRGTLHLWCAYPDDLMDEAAAGACVQLLSEEERARWQGFKFEQHRREYLATHALARIALSHCGDLAPVTWRFEENAYGKPAIAPACGLRFNLSNSLGMVVCLVAEGIEVGVDVEARARAGSITEVGPRMFSAQERAQLEALSETERPERALRLWILKESYVKARGMGMAMPLNRFSFLFGGAEGIRMAIDPGLDDEPLRRRFCLLEHADHCMALMVESRTAREVKVWEARLPSAVPRPLELGTVRWFAGAASLREAP